ncbi:MULTISPECIES: NADPH-dependent FMN reductase [Actinomadura]|uniref:NADPH-dependent FMN reductase n=1 Tax=Actinomadura yumaensis TaxID=111807 RepID=A0ABW2CUN9_9ACTN|nr:NAD(P)H-dependent oxidoreductase [Actinomadura sp. J1-007]MWK36305.1 NADPH-dependent oxidoreductase [Actinomadura sp. J1-007]
MGLRVVIIIGSTRSGRFGPTVAGWFAGHARRRPGLDVDLLDLAEAGLPDVLTDQDEPLPEPVRALAPRLAAADAFVVVAPEYNRGFPAPLKTALDWYYDEWRAKPVALVTYGRESGGLHAAAQLREVFGELHAVPIRDGVSLPCYWELFAADGSWPKPGATCDADAATTLDRLCWWARALRDARSAHPYTD